MQLSDNERKTVDKEVKDMLYGYCNDLRSQGLQAQFHYMDNGGQFFWLTAGSTSAQGLDSTLAIAGRAMANVSVVNRSYDTLLVQPLTTTLAAYSARVRSVVTYTGGKDTTLLTVETGTLVKRREGWRFLYGQTTALPFTD